MQQNWASSFLLDQPCAFSKYLHPLILFLTRFFHLNHNRRLIPNAGTRQVLEKEEALTTRPAPVEQQDEPVDADEPAAENEAEVELDSLDHLLFNSLTPLLIRMKPKLATPTSRR